MDKLIEDLKAATAALDKNQQQIKHLEDKKPWLLKKLQTAEAVLSDLQKEKHEAIEKSLLEKIPEERMAEVVNSVSEMIVKVEILTSSVDASEKLIGRLNTETADLVNKKNQAESRVWKVIADDYKNKIIEAVGDLPERFSAATEATSPGHFISVLWGDIFTSGTVSDRRRIRDDLRAELGF